MKNTGLKNEELYPVKTNPKVIKEAIEIALELVKEGKKESTRTLSALGLRVFIDKKPKMNFFGFIVQENEHKELVGKTIYIGSNVTP